MERLSSLADRASGSLTGKGMKVALIWPRGFDPIYIMPLSLGYLKSNVEPGGHTVRLFDCSLDGMAADSPRLARELHDFGPDVVGVSCMSFSYREGTRILEKAKSELPRAVTVMGGAHATCYAEAAIANPAIDYLLTAEAEISFPVFLEEIAKRTPDLPRVPGLVRRSPGGGFLQNPVRFEPDLDKIRIPDYRAMRLDEYLRRGYRYNTRRKRNAPVWLTRGCPYRCRFCSVAQLNGRKVRAHSVPYIADWVRRLYREHDVRMFSIIDDGFTTDMDMAKEFCRTMIGLGLPGLGFSTPTGIRAQRTDDELLGLMKRAGWEFVCVAPESGSKRTLKRMQKDLDLDSFPETVARIRAAGLKVHGFFIVGYPGETRQDLKATSRFIRRCSFDLLFISNFQPLPGTPVYAELVRSGEIPDGLVPGNYSDGHRAYTPEGLQGFNFPLFVLKEFLWLALSRPRNVPYIFQVLNPRMIGKKLWVNTCNMVRAMLSRQRAHRGPAPSSV